MAGVFTDAGMTGDRPGTQTNVLAKLEAGRSRRLLVAKHDRTLGAKWRIEST